jgi:ribonuclease HII
MEVRKMSGVSEIKKELDIIKYDDREGFEKFINAFGDDKRAGVISLVDKAKKKIEAYENEIERSENMLCYEKKYYAEGANYICGIDEVGRGPFAGPVVTAAVILPKDELILWLNDSKKLSKAKREELYDEITKRAVAWEIGIRSEKVIDDINIRQATIEAMDEAVSKLSVKPDVLLIDALEITSSIKQEGIVKGDAKSASIAAASIVAKVTRDRMMEEYDKVYPGYYFAENAGYGVPKHIEALKKLGPCPIHRRSFIKNYV